MGSGPIKIGIVGLGRAGWGMHNRELEGKKDLFEIVAACDLLPERRQKMAEAHDCRTYENVADLIADPQVELVDIASRSKDHYAHAVMALQAGKYVFLEKPMCATYEEALALQKLAAGYPNKLYIRHNRRFESGFQHIREIIASGILGEVYEIKLRRLSFQRRDDWQTLKEHSGGQLLNWGPHIVDHALRFLSSAPVSIWSNLKNVVAAGDAEDHLRIIMTDEAGLVVDLGISGGVAIGEPEYLIWGTRGALSSSGSSIKLKYLHPDKELAPRTPKPGTPEVGVYSSPDDLEWIEETIKVAPQRKAGMTQIWDELYDAIRNEIPFPITLEEAVQVMEVIGKVKQGTPFA